MKYYKEYKILHIITKLNIEIIRFELYLLRKHIQLLSCELN